MKMKINSKIVIKIFMFKKWLFKLCLNYVLILLICSTKLGQYKTKQTGRY